MSMIVYLFGHRNLKRERNPTRFFCLIKVKVGHMYLQSTRVQLLSTYRLRVHRRKMGLNLSCMGPLLDSLIKFQ